MKLCTIREFDNQHNELIASDHISTHMNIGAISKISCILCSDFHRQKLYHFFFLHIMPLILLYSTNSSFFYYVFNAFFFSILAVLRQQTDGRKALKQWNISPVHWIKQLRWRHYTDVIMGIIASQITSFTIVYLTVYSDADQRKYQSSASLAFVWGIHRRPVNSPHKWPVTRKMFTFDDVIMDELGFVICSSAQHTDA